MNSTAALIISVVIAFGITAGLGFVIIPWLRKLKFGQTILDIGPKWHKSKQGTPNMGGLMFIIGIVISFSLTVLIYHLSGGNLESEYSSIMNGRELVLLLAGLILALGCGAVGFIDDFTKIKLKRNEGLSPKQKTLGQLIVTLGYITTLWVSHNTSWYIPFIGTVNFEKNIFEDTSFLENFFYNLWTGSNYELKNRYAHIDYVQEENRKENIINNQTLEEQAIINILKNKPTVTQEEIASEINKSLRTVKKYMAEMQEKGLIKRVNSRKNGKWIVKLYNK